MLDCLAAEIDRFAQLLRALPASAWSRPTRCEGWTVHDVCAHVAGQLNDIADGRLADLGSDAATARQVAERRSAAPEVLVDELERAAAAVTAALERLDDTTWSSPSAMDVGATLGQDIEALVSDTYVHADDVLAAVGEPPDRGRGLRIAAAHLADLLDRRGWGTAVLAGDDRVELVRGLDGEPARAQVSVDLHDFVLAATGRSDPSALGLDSTLNTYD